MRHEIITNHKYYTGMLELISDPGAHSHTLFVYPLNCHLYWFKCIKLEVEVDFPEKL